MKKSEIIRIVESENAALFKDFPAFEDGKTSNPLTNMDGSMKDHVWLPEKIKKLLIEEYKTPDERKTQLALIKFFNPYGSGTWWVSEYDPEADQFFGLCNIFESELGYVSNQELREQRVMMVGTPMPLERDLHFVPTKLGLLDS